MNIFGFEKLFKINVKLWFFPVSEQKHFFVWRETFPAWFSKLLSPCPRELSSKKLSYIEKILLLLLIPVLWAETYQTFGKKVLAELLKQHSSCPNGSFEVKIFLSKLNLFINIVEHWAKTCWFLAKNVRHCCQSCILRVEENFWLKKTLHRDKFSNKFFWTMSGIFSGLWRKSLRWVFQKSLFHVQRKDPKKTALMKTIFFEKFKILSQFFFIFAEKFQKCYQYCFLHIQRSFFRFLKI